jgi:hypothetical protein
MQLNLKGTKMNSKVKSILNSNQELMKLSLATEGLKHPSEEGKQLSNNEIKSKAKSGKIEWLADNGHIEWLIKNGFKKWVMDNRYHEYSEIVG